MKKISVGVIGLGRISPRHIADSIDKIEALELAAVCDIDESTFEPYQNRDIAFYTGYNDLINDNNVDVVAIATPNGYHFEMAKAVAKAGKHCVLEKPITQDQETAQQLVEIFGNSDGILFPVLQVRFNPVIQKIKEVIKNNNLGKLFSATLTIRWTRPQEYFDESDWKGTKDMDGGSLLTQAIHYIDATQYILGPVDSAFGTVETAVRDIETEDTVKALLSFKNGFNGLLEFTVATYPHNLESSLMIMGETGTVKIGGKAMNELEEWLVENMPRPSIEKGLDPNVYAGGKYTGSCPNHYRIYENVVEVLQHEKKPYISGQDAVHAIEIIRAIKSSSSSGKVEKI